MNYTNRSQSQKQDRFKLEGKREKDLVFDVVRIGRYRSGNRCTSGPNTGRDGPDTVRDEFEWIARKSIRLTVRLCLVLFHLVALFHRLPESEVAVAGGDCISSEKVAGGEIDGGDCGGGGWGERKLGVLLLLLGGWWWCPCLCGLTFLGLINSDGSFPWCLSCFRFISTC